MRGAPPDDDAHDREALRQALPRPTSDAADTLLAALHRSRLAASLFGDTSEVMVDRYIIRRELGRGGMGVVFAAEDPLLAVPVALKLLQRGRTPGDGAAESQLQREAQALARVRGDHVVRVYSAGFFMDQPWIAMQLVDGPHLGEWLQARREAGRVDWREVLARYVEAGRGLQAIHAAGLVHRDFKPQNAVVDADGCVKVLDFGLAIASSEHVSAGEPRLGTHRYAAPEQFLARDEGPRSDQFSFCVALYEALCDAPPFGDAVATGSRLANDPTAKLPRPPVELPGWLCAALERGLAARPAARHPNMAALLHELTRDRRRGLRIAALVGAGAVIGLLAAVLAVPRLAGDPRCELASSDPWDEHRPQLRLADGEQLRLDTAVTGWRRRWQATRAELCATTPRPDEATLGLRHTCLTYAHTTFVAVLTRAAAQPAVLGDALVHLPAPEGCLDLASSPRNAGAPASPELAAQIEGELAEVEAARLYGDRTHAQLHVDRARQLIAGCGDPRLVARVGFAQGIVARESGDRRGAAEALGAALASARSADPALAVEIFHERVRLDLLTYQHDRDGQRDLDDAARLLQSIEPWVAGDRLATLRAEHHDMRGVWFYEAADTRQALVEHAAAILAWKQMPVRPDVQRHLLESLRSRARTHASVPDPAAAIADNNEALVLARDLLGPDHPVLIDIYLGLAREHANRSEWPSARAAAQEARRLLANRDVGDAARSMCTLAALERDLGDSVLAEQEARKAADLAAADPDSEPVERASCDYLLATLAVHNHSSDADDRLQRALTSLEGSPGPQAACDRAMLQAIRGLNAVRDGDLKLADSLTRAAPRPDCGSESLVFWVRAQVARQRGDLDAAERAYSEAIAHRSEYLPLQQLELARLLHTHAPKDPRVRELAAAAEPELRRQNFRTQAGEAARLAAP